MLTDRFHEIRKQELEKVFSKSNIIKVWRKIVRDQLRRTDILDIFDYYDINYNIEERATLLRRDILDGNYLPSKPLIYRIEKKFGICRHLIVPQPIDALVLQILTEDVREPILKNQPSKNAFYSRDKHNVRKPHEIDEYGLNWRQLWQKMQKKIYNFNKSKKLIITTDLTNYYDTIFIPELRKIVTGFVNNKESVLDILFKIIETITWIPDYLPYSGRSLPTTNLEAIRLLAHSFLFELDMIIEKKSDSSFTRWMDDIVIGVNSRDEAVEILSSMSDILKSRGLALNIKKTNIYSAKEAEFHFLIQENKYLDSIDYDSCLKHGISNISNKLYSRFKQHNKNNQDAKYFDKVSKRYITAFSKIKSRRILRDIPKLFNEQPNVRLNILYYLSSLGYSKRTSVIVLDILDKLKLYDDISLFSISKLVTDWAVPFSSDGEDFINKFIDKLKGFSEKRKQHFDFYCILWVMTKYEHPESLFNFITKYDYIWKTHPFLRRQVASIMSRILMFNQSAVINFLEKQIATSEPQVVSVANTILKFMNLENLESKVRMYLFPKAYRTYPLQKFLVLCSFLNSKKIREDYKCRKQIKKHIADPYYRKWIELQYNIKFT